MSINLGKSPILMSRHLFPTIRFLLFPNHLGLIHQGPIGPLLEVLPRVLEKLNPVRLIISPAEEKLCFTLFFLNGVQCAE